MGWVDKYTKAQSGYNTKQIDSILNANKHLGWVDRLYKKDGENIQIEGVEGTSTHYMSQFDNRAVPTVDTDSITGKLKHFKDVDGKFIKERGIKFPSDQEALDFTKDYKKGTGVLPKAQAGITKKEKVKYDKEEAAKHPPKHKPLHLKDNRKISATTNEPIRPNVDLISGVYDLNRMDNITNYAKNKGLSKEDVWNLMAMDLQETKWGKTDDQTGHVKDSNGGANPDEIFVNAYIYKMKRADELGITDPVKRLQIYNGDKALYRTTESGYHGFDMDKAYGVPIPEEGISMKENPLYGKRITDYKENVLKKNERVQKYIDSSFAAPKYDVNANLYPPEELTPWELDLKQQFEDAQEEMKRNEPINGVKKKAQHGIIEDDRGQWAHPGEITKINSNDITMKGVNYPVLGISDEGDKKMMMPGQDYKFKGKSVTEYPMAQNGDILQKSKKSSNFTSQTNWLDKYTK